MFVSEVNLLVIADVDQIFFKTRTVIRATNLLVLFFVLYFYFPNNANQHTACENEPA